MRHFTPPEFREQGVKGREPWIPPVVSMESRRPWESRSEGAASEARRPAAKGLPWPSASSPPDPEVEARSSRRRYTPKYKLEILRKADACTRPGQVGELLRKEG